MKKTIQEKEKNNLQCFQCLPSRPLNGHPAFHGILVHSRIDCPKDQVYMINEKQLSQKEPVQYKKIEDMTKKDWEQWAKGKATESHSIEYGDKVQKEPEEWEIEFDKKFTVIVTYQKDPDYVEVQLLPEPIYRFTDFPNTNPNAIKTFIRSLLSSQRTQTIEETRKLVEKDREMFFKQGTTEEQLEEAHKIRKELRREILVDFDSLK